MKGMLLWESITDHPANVMTPMKELRDASTPAALILTGEFNLPDINWEFHTADTNRPRRFLKHLDDKFLVQVLREPTRKGTLLNPRLSPPGVGLNDPCGSLPTWGIL